MNKNKVFSIILSVTLLSSGQSFCAGVSYSDIISDYMQRSDLIKSISKYLPSRQHKMMFGVLSAAAVAGLIYCGYQKYYGAGSDKPEVGSEKPNTQYFTTPFDVSVEPGKVVTVDRYCPMDFDAGSNWWNVRRCLEKYNPHQDDNKKVKEAFSAAVCPVLERFCSNYSQKQWIEYSDKVISSYPLDSQYVKQWGYEKGMLLKLTILVQESCPNNAALPSLKKAVQDCASITEELVKDNPTLIKFSDFKSGSRDVTFGAFAAEIKKQHLHIRQ